MSLSPYSWRPQHGFIRPDGTWLVGPTVHHALAQQELRRRRWRVVRRPDVKIGSDEIATLLQKGYVRVADGCDFEVWRAPHLTREALVEMQATYLSRGCETVRIDQIGGGGLRVLHPQPREGFGSVARPVLAVPAHVEEAFRAARSAWSCDLDGACIELAVLMHAHLTARRHLATLVRRILPHGGGGHWTVLTSSGEFDPTITSWSDNPTDAAPGTLYVVRRGSPHRRWRRAHTANASSAYAVVPEVLVRKMHTQGFGGIARMFL